MRLLAHMELAVGELAQVLEQSQPRVSRHIRILCDAGLAERRKEGSWVFLRSAVSENRAPPMGAAAAQLLTAAERDDDLFAARCYEDRRRLTAIRTAREATAEEYFSRHAEEWDDLRLLHSPDEPVEAALTKALSARVDAGRAPDGSMQDAGSLGSLLDIGTGTGRIAELFAPRAAHITALDKNPEMLRIARARLQTLPADQIELVQGDFTALPFDSGSFDTVLFHQVLHYALEPEAVLAEAARVTRSGGHIGIVDFAAHDREELRTAHAHARLGFSNEQMLDLLGGAGFSDADAIALPGAPLTVKIWTAIRKSATASHKPPNAI